MRLRTREDYHKKIMRDYSKIALFAQVMREFGRSISVTIGSFDLLHIGHTRYLLETSLRGDIVIVGVDSDRAIKIYKGEKAHRPLVPENERMEMLCYLPFVDVVTLIDDVDDDKKWEYKLLDIVKPDTFVAVTDSYPPEQIEDIRRFCANVEQLPRQADDTSTSNLVEKIMKGHQLAFLADLLPVLKKHGIEP